MRIEKLSITVTVEGDAQEGERAFARLFDKFSTMRDERREAAIDRTIAMERDRSLSPDGGRG